MTTITYRQSPSVTARSNATLATQEPARDEMAETVYQRAMQCLWEGADSSAGYCGGEAGHVAGHRGGGGIVDRPGHLRAELTSTIQG